MRNPFRKTREVCLVKKAKLTKSGWEITYHTEIDGVYVKESLSYDKKDAEDFFDKVVFHRGDTEVISVVKSRKI